MHIANIYNIKYLEDLCCDKLATNLNEDNICTYFNECHLMSNSFSAKCEFFLLYHMKTLIAKNMLLNLNNSAILYILQLSKSSVSERDLYKLLLDRTIHLGKQRSEIENVIQHIRFGTMQVSEFVSCIKSDLHFLTDNEIGKYFRAILMNKDISRKMLKHVSSTNLVSSTFRIYKLSTDSEIIQIKANKTLFIKSFETTSIGQIYNRNSMEEISTNYYYCDNEEIAGDVDNEQYVVMALVNPIILIKGEILHLEIKYIDDEIASSRFQSEGTIKDFSIITLNKNTAIINILYAYLAED